MRTPDSTNSFEKGMNRDYNPKLQPQGTTRCVVNGVYLSEDGDIFSLTNEKGTVIYVTLPTGYKVIGRYTLDTDIILFLVNPSNGFSQIGYINSFTTTYSKVLPISGENGDLNFSIDHPIDIQGRKIFTGDRMIYFTDNYNPYGFINLDNPPTTDIYSSTRINPLFNLPVIDYVETLESGGQLHGGVYQFVAQYLTRELNPVGYGIPCNPIPVVPNPRSVGRDKYEGAYPDNPTTIAKTLRLNITNLDDQFPFLQIVAIHYDTIGNIFTATALSPILNISAGQTNIIFDYTGDETGGTPLSREDVNSIPTIYDRAKTIEQKDNTLILSNLTQIQEKYNFQEVANNIITKYAIKEVPYVDGLTGNAALFVVSKPPFISSTPTWDFFVQFSQAVDITTATNVSNYEVIYDPNTPGTFINPVSVEIDPSNASLVIVHMDNAVPAQEIFVGVQVKIQNIKNFDLSQTVTTQTFQIITDSVTSIPSNLFFADYKDEALTFDGKGLMREEIYSFGFGVLWKNGSQSPVYPITGNDKLTTSTTDANTVTKLTGTYVSTIDYPLNQGYPIGKIRHHKMPSLQQEPHYRVDTGGNVFIRILGITFENIVIPPNVASDIQSIFFVRQPRTTSQNRSIIAQGLVNNMVLTANDYDFDTGNPVTSSNVYKKVPFFNNFSFTNNNAPAPFGSGKSVAWSMSSPIQDTGALFSPDIILGNVDINEFTKIKNVLLLNGNTQVINFNRSQNHLTQSVGSGSFYLDRPLTLWVFANYTNVNTSFTQVERDLLFTNLVGTGERKRVSSIFNDYDVDNSTSGKYLLFKTNDVFPTINPYTINVSFRANTNFPTIGEVTRDNNDTNTTPPLVNNYLYNFYKENLSQYGPIDGTEYVFMDQSLNPNITQFTTFNGDIFISKFSYGNKDDWDYKGIVGSLVLGVPTTNYQTARRDQPDGSGFQGVGLRALGYYFVESTINTNYRHQFIANPMGVEYFPKYSAFDTLLADPTLGDSTSYNTQYSYDNNIRTFASKPSVFFNTSGFETRSIYSQQAVLGETVDSYRIFPPNNFYDLPKHTGEIWDSFVENNILYLHTPKSLWRTYMNEVAQQTTDSSQIILGTSGIFTIPSREIFTEKGGYAGTISQWGGVHTPYGYIFPDSLQGKIFMLSNQSLTEISADGMNRYFNDNLSVLEVGDLGYIDNPFNPDSKGLHGVYDYEIKRYILTKYHVNTNKRFTTSYSLLTNSFASYHTYYPNVYININNKFYSINNSETQVKLYQHNVGPHGSYYGVVYPWSIQFVINKASNYDKVFDSLGISMETWDETTGDFIHLRPIGDTFHAFTNNKHTGNISLKYDNSIYATKIASEELVRFKGQRYQFQVSMDSVINDTQLIFDKSLYLNELLGVANIGNINQNLQFRGRIKGQFAIITLNFSNLSDYKTSIAMIDSNFRINAI